MEEGLFVNINTKFGSLWKKLGDKSFRDAFVVSQFKRSIPFQITALRKKREWSQEQLAEAAKVTQGVISRAENPNYGNLTLNTVLRVANGLDVAVVIEFVPFTKLLEIFEDRSEDEVPATYEQENNVIMPKTGALGITGERAQLAVDLLAALKESLPNSNRKNPLEDLGVEKQKDPLVEALHYQPAKAA